MMAWKALKMMTYFSIVLGKSECKDHSDLGEDNVVGDKCGDRVNVED